MMKKILYIFLFVFSYTYAQCPLEKLADDLVDGSEDFKEILNSSSGFDAYRVLSLAEEDKVIRVGKEVLDDVSQYLSSSSKSVANLASEIKNAGGYVKWKKLANTVGKTKIIRKLDALGELTNARRLINSLDDVADAPFLSRLDNLTNTQLQKLDEFYGSLKHPQGYAGQLDYTVTKTIGDVPVSITYKNGVPDLRGHSPILNFTDGTSAGKFKFESSNLTGKKTDFTQANTALARKFGVEKSGGNWPWNNGYMSNGNFRIAQTNSGGMSQQFELLENGNWVKYTWHHFEDGRTVFPVKTSIHSVPTGFNHSGGKSIISKGLQDLFEFIGF